MLIRQTSILFNNHLDGREKICQMAKIIEGMNKNKFDVVGILTGIIDGKDIEIKIHPCRDFDPVHCVVFIENLRGKGAVLKGLVKVFENIGDGWERGVH